MPVLAQDLRSSILLDTMKGKLTEQLETDSSVDELLRSIQLEKEQLIQEKKIKKGKPLAPISNEEIPFDIPDNWRWVYLQDVCKSITAGGDKPKKFSKTKTSELCIPIFSNGETNEGLFGFTDIPVITEPAITVSGRGTIGFSRVREANFVPIVRLIVITLLKETLNIDFLCLVLNTLLEAGQGTAVKQLTVPMICSKLIPIPPIEEQQRIVDKLNEIMPLIDEYEKLENQLAEIKDSFPGDMKAAVLQAAMEGKLTEQNHQTTYREIFDNKTPYFNDEDSYFEIPQNWGWCYLKDVSEVIGGFAFKSSQYTTEGVRVIRISDFNETGFINKSIVKYQFNDSLSRYLIKEKDILMCMTGGTVGKNFYIHNLNEELLLNQRVAAIRATKINSNFLNYIIKSPFIQAIINENKNSTNDNISMDLIKGFSIPLPPVEEQQRIVDKLDKVMPLIDGLKGVPNDKYR